MRPLAALADEAATYAALLGRAPRLRHVRERRLGRDRDAARRAAEPAPARATHCRRWSLNAHAPHAGPPACARRSGTGCAARVLTSATLTVAGSFAYFRDMTGLAADLDVSERVFPSPFDFRRQAVLVLEHDPGTAWHGAGASPGVRRSVSSASPK